MIQQKEFLQIRWSLSILKLLISDILLTPSLAMNCSMPSIMARPPKTRWMSALGIEAEALEEER